MSPPSWGQGALQHVFQFSHIARKECIAYEISLLGSEKPSVEPIYLPFIAQISILSTYSSVG